MKEKIISLLIACSSLFAPQLFAETFTVKSPDGKLQAVVNDGSQLTLSVSADGKTVLAPFAIGMKTDRADFGKNVKAKGSTSSSYKGEIAATYGIRSKIEDNYNQTEIDFDKYKLVVRAYNEAIAYRFASDFDGEITVFSETLDLPLSVDDKIIGHAVNGVQDSFERFFLRESVADMKKHHSYSLPFLAQKNGYTVAVVDSDVFDYPALRFAASSDSKPEAWFSKAPKTFKQRNKFTRTVDQSFDYIAKTKGKRSFPWRGFIVARKDIDLADNDTVYKLAEPSRLADTSWIKPGTCAWEWWSDCQLEGAGFVGGVNEQTYRYYADFAAENNIPYILLDAGWLTGVDVSEMKDGIDEALISGKTAIDVPGIIKYAHSKGVKVLLWCLGQSMDKYGEKAFPLMASWGADGVKIDFIDRDDQQAQGFYERMARLAAENKMVVDFHGCAKPAGIQRTYPNVVNFEAVRGCEFNKFSEGLEPSHNIDLVFTRMLQGPMDYTPGALDNVSKKNFRKSFSFPQMKGTRSQMAAMYVLFYAPVQMLCDSASEYKKYPDILHFIANTPTTWDDTKALEGKIGEYVVVARRKGDSWYIGGMSDWKGRTVEIDLSQILESDTDYKAEIIRDSVNSDRLPRDYKREVKEVNSESRMKIEMKSGGGFAIKLTPKRIPIIDDIIKFFTDDSED